MIPNRTPLFQGPTPDARPAADNRRGGGHAQFTLDSLQCRRLRLEKKSPVD
jgi:hypothetical protein